MQIEFLVWSHIYIHHDDAKNNRVQKCIAHNVAKQYLVSQVAFPHVIGI